MFRPLRNIRPSLAEVRLPQLVEEVPVDKLLAELGGGLVVLVATLGAGPQEKPRRRRIRSEGSDPVDRPNGVDVC